MTTPVAPPDDLVSGCVQYLRGIPQVALVFANPGDAQDLFVSDARPSDAELAGNLACVVSWLGPSGSGNQHNSFAAQRLQIELWCAPSVGGGMAGVGDCRIRLWGAAKTIDDVLHQPYALESWWGTVRVVGCLRLAGMTPYEIPDSGGVWRGTAIYEVGLG